MRTTTVASVADEAYGAVAKLQAAWELAFDAWPETPEAQRAWVEWIEYLGWRADCLVAIARQYGVLVIQP